MSLQVQYRPKSFKNFVGNKATVEGLSTILARPNPPSAFLLTGQGGTGKTTLGRIIRRTLNCANSDFKELNAADDRGIDAIRELIESMKFAPLSGNKKVFLLDEAHLLTMHAQEALLKALEEPPEYVHWIICTTNPEVLKPTFKRRCHIYELELLRYADMAKLIRMVLKREKRDNAIDQEVRDKIIELAEGSAGVALKLLDMVIDMDDPGKIIDTLQSAGTSDSDVLSICRALLNDNLNKKAKWTKIRAILKDYKGDGESMRRPILGYMEKVMLNNNSDISFSEEVFFIMQPFMKNFFDSGKAGLVAACYEAVFGIE